MIFTVCVDWTLMKDSVKKNSKKIMSLQWYKKSKKTSVDQTGSKSFWYGCEENLGLMLCIQSQDPELAWIEVISDGKSHF